MDINSHSPYTIGFFTTGVELEYSYILFKAVEKIAQENQVNLVNFLGGSLDPAFTFHQYKYQYQCNVAFNYASPTTIDGIILASGVLSSFINPEDFNHFYSQYAPIPMVSLGANIEGMPSVYTDNRAVFKQFVSHLIKVHGKKHIGFISGPSSNCDALERYAGYREALSENGLLFDPEYIYIGDFTPTSGAEAIRVFFDEKKLPLDGIVCANDSMALAALGALQKRGISIPNDVALSGFDNVYSASYSVPSLSSIEQPLEAFAREAFSLLLDLIKGKTAPNKMIPSKIIYRESCGCTLLPSTPLLQILENISNSDQTAVLAKTFLKQCSSFLPEHFTTALTPFITKIYSLLYLSLAERPSSQLLVHTFLIATSSSKHSLHMSLNLKNFINFLKSDLIQHSPDLDALCVINDVLGDITLSIVNDSLNYYRTKTDRLNKNFSFIRQVLLSVTLNIHDKRHQLHSIIPDLITYGISSCLIYLYPKEIIHNLSDDWHMPSTLSLSMGYVDNTIIDLDAENNVFLPTDIVNYGLTHRHKTYTSFIHPIFFSNEQLGIIVLELQPQDYYLIETLTVELGCALKLSSVFNTQKLSESKLKKLSETDELTGLLNRRGFFKNASKCHNWAKLSYKSGILFYIDIDDLKKINDTYGHSEGDLAIMATSNILKKTFSKEDIIGRMGGDEFTILCFNKPSTFIQTTEIYIQALCEAYNKEANTPYKLSMSLGILPFSTSTNDSLETLLSSADHLLYKAKKKKNKKDSL